MVEKIALMMFLAAVLILVGGQNSQAEAREVYMGNYSDGSAVYLLTETISRGNRGFECTVRAGRDYLTYRFGLRNRSWYYSNSEGYEGWVYGGSSPVAASICDYVTSHY